MRFLTGHSRKGGEDPLYVAESAADPDSTLVIYMGLQTLPGLVSKLIKNGLDENTPSVAVERGTTPEQRTVSYFYLFPFKVFFLPFLFFIMWFFLSSGFFEVDRPSKAGGRSKIGFSNSCFYRENCGSVPFLASRKYKFSRG